MASIYLDHNVSLRLVSPDAANLAGYDRDFVPLLRHLLEHPYEQLGAGIKQPPPMVHSPTAEGVSKPTNPISFLAC